jgi:hypothetical protein
MHLSFIGLLEFHQQSHPKFNPRLTLSLSFSFHVYYLNPLRDQIATFRYWSPFLPNTNIQQINHEDNYQESISTAQ